MESLLMLNQIQILGTLHFIHMNLLFDLVYVQRLAPHICCFHSIEDSCYGVLGYDSL